jgi:hypothetical protein
MEQDLQQSIALLERAPKAFDGLLCGLPEAWTRATEGANAKGEPTWSAYEILGHLIYGEQSNWLPRARWIREVGEREPFAAFDRTGYVELIKGKSMDQLLDAFAEARKSSLDAVRSMNLTPEDLALRGTHPAYGTVTLSQLIAAWSIHDLTHLHQLSRLLAHQYREAVGPWINYLGVLHCTPHGG